MRKLPRHVLFKHILYKTNLKVLQAMHESPLAGLLSKNNSVMAPIIPLPHGISGFPNVLGPTPPVQGLFQGLLNPGKRPAMGPPSSLGIKSARQNKFPSSPLAGE
jgi:hypothetical protein